MADLREDGRGTVDQANRQLPSNARSSPNTKRGPAVHFGKGPRHDLSAKGSRTRRPDKSAARCLRSVSEAVFLTIRQATRQ